MPQFLNYYRNFLIKISHLRELGIVFILKIFNYINKYFKVLKKIIKNIILNLYRGELFLELYNNGDNYLKIGANLLCFYYILINNNYNF